jgi:DNA invertase Pin-like site-specific DNA recombinase
MFPTGGRNVVVKLNTRRVAYSYIRFSTPEQMKGDSLRRQVDKTAAWCRKNGYHLDTEHHLRDLGVSGFRGDHRHKDNADRYALAGFLEMVRRGVVCRGSVLICERFDRLTREAVRPALTLILNLIEAGIVIVQLEPETILDESADEYRLLTVIMELRRGNSESVAKSDRNGAAWENKRAVARENRTLMTGRLPFWLKVVGRKKEGNRVVGGEVVVDENKTALVRRIFRMSLNGKGIYEITKTLNAEGVKHRKNHWRSSHVAYLLANRAVLGEFQPYTGKHPNRKPSGEPIPGYYPQVIDERTFYSVREGLADRRTRKPGRPGKEKVYLFSGLIHDGRNCGKIQYATIGLQNSGVKLVAGDALDRLPGAGFISFPATIFERSILKAMTEVKVADVLPTDDGASLLSELGGKLADVEARRDKIKAKLKANPDAKGLSEILGELDNEQQQVAAELAAERQRQSAGTMGEAWGEVQSLAELAENADNETRTRLRTALRRVIDSVWVVFFGNLANWKGAVIQVNFKGGHTRVYAVHHKFKHRTRPAITRVENYKTAGLAALDMRTTPNRDELIQLLELNVKALGERQ